MEEILEMLEGKQKLVLYGCGGRTTVFHTGGEPEVKQMADPERDRAWQLIYERLEKLDALEMIKHFIPPKDYSKMTGPRKIDVAPLASNPRPRQ